MAAKAAADKNQSVIICDENPEMGGWLLSDTDILIDGKSGSEWAANMVAELTALENVRLMTRTTGFGYFQQNMVGLSERVTEHLSRPDPDSPRERMWQIRTGKVIIAQGAIERHMVFPDKRPPRHFIGGCRPNLT